MRGTANAMNLPPDELQESELEAKALAVLIDKLSLAGHTVHTGRAGGFTVSRWGMARHCQDFDSLRDFACQLGVA